MEISLIKVKEEWERTEVGKLEATIQRLKERDLELRAVIVHMADQLIGRVPIKPVESAKAKDALIVDLQANLNETRRELENAIDHVGKMSVERNDLQKANAKQDMLIKELREGNEELAEENADLNAKAVPNSDLIKANAKLVAENHDLRMQVERLEGEVEQIDNLRSERDRAIQAAHNLQRSVDELREDKKGLIKDRDRRHEEAQSEWRKRMHAEDQLELAKKELADRKVMIGDLKGKVKALEDRVEMLDRNNSFLVEEKQQWAVEKLELNNMISRLHEGGVRLKGLEDEKRRLEVELGAKHSDIKELHKIIEEFRTNNEDLHKLVDELKERNAELEEQCHDCKEVDMITSRDDKIKDLKGKLAVADKEIDLLKEQLSPDMYGKLAEKDQRIHELLLAGEEMEKELKEALVYKDKLIEGIAEVFDGDIPVDNIERSLNLLMTGSQAVKEAITRDFKLLDALKEAAAYRMETAELEQRKQAAVDMIKKAAPGAWRVVSSRPLSATPSDGDNGETSPQKEESGES